ncbi:MAG TPA: RNA polymerase factor sigma-54 [Candidatus Methylacidiphilales bacterium]|nr:RNA polymerase factor sigma-54 [Candidatus Methylacidiphilales bacterium]
MAGIGLHQNLSLGQTLSPQMQQSLQFLQAPALELQSLIQQEIEINPVLEEVVEETKTETENEEWDKKLEELRQKDEEWREYFSQNNTSTTSYSPEAAERRQFLFDSQVEAPHLSDHLMRQLTLATSNADMIRVGEEIVGNLDDAGFLKIPLVEVAQSAQVDYTVAQNTLSLIQTFDPVGVAARDLRECLLIQIDRLGKSEEIEAVMVSQYLNELGRKKYQDIARALKVPLDRVQAAAQFIATLQPRPGSSFSSEDKQNIVQAELAVQKNGDDWTVVMNDDPVPRLRISDTYKDLLVSNGNDPNLREYLKEKIRAGKFLIKCLHQRQQTIFNIATEIVKRQRTFFDQGVAHLKPLTMNQVAEVVGVHETTVSRAIANKYVQTPYGLFDLKYFFTPGYQTTSGEVMSNTSVKDAIQELIARENPSKPLSDQEIVKILSERGIPLARRTVAKYRAELGLLPSNLRRSA